MLSFGVLGWFHTCCVQSINVIQTYYLTERSIATYALYSQCGKVLQISKSLCGLAASCEMNIKFSMLSHSPEHGRNELSEHSRGL